MNIIADHEIPYLHLFEEAGFNIIPIAGRALCHDAIKTADGLLIRSITPVNKELLNNTTIKWVGSLTAGTDHIDHAWLSAHDIDWFACPGFNAPPVADYVVSTIATLIQRGYFQKTHLRAAVIGVGQVGSLVVNHLQTLGFTVVLVDPLRKERDPDFPHTPLTEIGDVDLICIHTPLTKVGVHATHHLISADFMMTRRENTVLLNAARGEVVDTAALLSHGKQLITCLDVFEHEPAIDLNVLTSTMLATPHIAGHAKESKWRGIQMLYQQVMQRTGRMMQPLTSPICEHVITLSPACDTWDQAINQVFNVTEYSDSFKHALQLTSTVSATFDQIRKQQGSRHEFSNTRLLNTENLSARDKTILQQLGFQLA